jgi:protein-disulfide isomerase
MMTQMNHLILSHVAVAAAISLASLVPATPAMAAAPAAATAPAAPKKIDWTRTYAASPDGSGFIIGNPKAPMTITEYGSYTCSHCAHFAEAGIPKLMPYVASGKVRFEFRSYLRNSPDIVVSMITYCQTPTRFFRLSDMMFARVQDWTKGFSNISEADQAAWKDKPLGQILPQVSAKAGVTAFMQQRGLAAATTNACLNNQATLAKLQSSQKVAYEKYKVQGTPTFLMNGVILEGVGAWETLEPRIKAGK